MRIACIPPSRLNSNGYFALRNNLCFVIHIVEAHLRPIDHCGLITIRLV